VKRGEKKEGGYKTHQIRRTGFSLGRAEKEKKKQKHPRKKTQKKTQKKQRQTTLRDGQIRSKGAPWYRIGRAQGSGKAFTPKTGKESYDTSKMTYYLARAIVKKKRENSAKTGEGRSHEKGKSLVA